MRSMRRRANGWPDRAGVGVLAVRPALMQRLQPRLPPPEWVGSLSVAERLELGEANVAARVGFSVAIGEHLAAGPGRGARPAGRGGPGQPDRPRRRAGVAGGRGGRRAERHHDVGATATGPTRGKIRAWLIAERRIVTTAVVIERAPLELTAPVLRISPHVDTTADDLATFASALAEATAAGC